MKGEVDKLGVDKLVPVDLSKLNDVVKTAESFAARSKQENLATKCDIDEFVKKNRFWW